MSPEKLVYMANKIGKFFAHGSEKDAVFNTVDHLKKFWDPRMRKAIVEYVAGGGGGYSRLCCRQFATSDRMRRQGLIVSVMSSLTSSGGESLLRAIAELGSSRALVRGHFLHVFEGTTIGEVGGDPGGAKRVATPAAVARRRIIYQASDGGSSLCRTTRCRCALARYETASLAVLGDAGRGCGCAA